MSTSTSPCKFFKIHIDNSGAPLLGTMQAYPDAKTPVPCNQVLLYNYQVQVPVGHQVCRFPNHLRYYYKINKFTTEIIPNSMFSLPTAPPAWCVGNESILEYIKIQ